MSQHLESWLDAYIDGELTDRQQKKLENHLENCPECLLQLEKRQRLSSLLQTVPTIADLKSSEQFAAEVNLMLPREQKKQKSNLSNVLWVLIPFGLMAVIVFLQALSLFSNAINLIPGVNNLFYNTFSSSGQGLTLFPWLKTTIEGAMIWTGTDWLFRWNTLTYLFLMMMISFLYLVWMAIWWVRKHQTNLQNS